MSLILEDSHRGESCSDTKEMGGAPATGLSFFPDGIVGLLKRWRALPHLSGPCAVIGILLLFSPLIEGGTTHFPVLIIRLILFATMFAWMSHQMKRGFLPLLRSTPGFLVLLFLGWAGLTLFWSPYKNASVQWCVSLLTYALLFYMVLQGIQSRSHIQVIGVLLLGMGAFEGMFGITQYVWFGEARAKGTFFNPNFFAAYEGAILALALGILSFVRKRELTLSGYLMLWSTVAITCCAFVLAQSRGALVALVVTLTFIGFCRFGKVALLLIALSLVTGFMVPNPLRERIVEVSVTDPYAYTRLDIWKTSLTRLVDHPLGIGLGMYKYGSFQDRFPIEENIVRYGKRPESAHNEYLQMGVEVGVVGLAVFLIGVGIWVWNVREVWRQRLEPFERGLVTGLTAATLGILVHATVDSTFHEPALVLVLIISGTLMFSLHLLKGLERISWVRVPFRYHPIRVALMGVCGMALVVLIIQPAAAWYAHERGEIEARSGNIDTALDWYTRAAIIDRGTSAYHDSIARLAVQMFHRSNDPEWLIKAAEEETIAMELNPLDGRFPYRLGTIYSLMADQHISGQQRELLWDGAAGSYSKAIDVDPFSPFSYFELAKLRIRQDHLEEAKRLLEKAKLYEPNFLPGRALLLEMALKLTSADSLQREFNEMKTIQSTFERRILNETERQFLDVDLYPLGRMLAVEVDR
jgi:O-antigen ligase